MKKIYFLAFIMAGVVAFAVYMFASQLRDNSLRDDRPRQQVVVAATDIPANTLIMAEMVTLTEVPAEAVHPQSVRNLTDAIGKINQYPIAPQEPVLSSRLKDRSDEADKLSYALPSGYRAITLSVDNVSGVAGYLTQGDRVDLVVNTVVEGVSLSRFQSEDLLVIRLGDISSDPSLNIYQSVTLAATPEEILRINHAVNNGRITLVLRPVTDKGPSNVEAFSEDAGLTIENASSEETLIDEIDRVESETEDTNSEDTNVSDQADENPEPLNQEVA